MSLSDISESSTSAKDSGNIREQLEKQPSPRRKAISIARQEPAQRDMEISIRMIGEDGPEHVAVSLEKADMVDMEQVLEFFGQKGETTFRPEPKVGEQASSEMSQKTAEQTLEAFRHTVGLTIFSSASLLVLLASLLITGTSATALVAGLMAVMTVLTLALAKTWHELR